MAGNLCQVKPLLGWGSDGGHMGDLQCRLVAYACNRDILGPSADRPCPARPYTASKFPLSPPPDHYQATLQSFSPALLFQPSLLSGPFHNRSSLLPSPGYSSSPHLHRSSKQLLTRFGTRLTRSHDDHHHCHCRPTRLKRTR